MNSVGSKAEKSIDFFKESKVDTCSYVKILHGQPVAIAYPSSTQNKNNDLIPTEKRSFSHDVHRIRNHLYAGMKNKPLQSYNPDAQRSRLRTEEFQIPYKNSSSVIIGDRSSTDKKHFITTARLLLRKPRMNFTSNLGILSAQARWQRKMNN